MVHLSPIKCGSDKMFVMQRVSIFLCALIGGCVFSPGSHIPANIPIENAEPAIAADIFGIPLTFEDNPSQISVTRFIITPELIDTLHHTTHLNAEANYLPKEFAHSSDDDYAYEIGNGDVLSVMVWDHPELTAPFGSFNSASEQGNVVREDGTIFYPFVGAVEAAGRTAFEIRTELTDKLGTYIESPQLDVRVAAYKSQRFFVTGAVSAPGAFPVTNIPTTLLDAISLAGGLLEDGDLFDLKFTRDDKTFSIPLNRMLYDGDLDYNLLMQDGDILNVVPNTQHRAFVLGEVIRPGSVSLTQRPLSLTQALIQSGGIDETRADGRGVYVVRTTDMMDSVDLYQLDVREAWTLALGDSFILQPRDIVYVTPAPITRWNRFITNVLPSLQGLQNIDRISGN